VLGPDEVSKSSNTESQRSTPWRVLVVDDHEPLLTVLREVLLASGFDPVVMNNATDALLCLEQQVPDIIVCDVLMPGMNGFEFFQKVCENEKTFKVPFIFLTGLSDPEEIRFGKEKGCDDYLIKPFDPNDLVAVIRGKLNTCKKRDTANERQMEAYRRRIIQSLSHEFRTPLVAINTGTELLLEQFDRMEGERVSQLLKSIQRGGARLQGLIDDFMTLQQIDSGSAKSTCDRFKDQCDFYNLVANSITTFLETYRDTSPLIEFSRPEGKGPRVLVCRNQVEDVLRRLLSNAVKFGGKDKAVTVTFTCSENKTSVFFRDRGQGAAPELMQEAKELFKQIDRDRMEQQGCGIGLTIAGYLCDINGGAIHFHQPADNIGLEVEISFPVVEAS